jgi:hypothetical protein
MLVVGGTSSGRGWDLTRLSDFLSTEATPDFYPYRSPMHLIVQLVTRCARTFVDGSGQVKGPTFV